MNTLITISVTAFLTFFITIFTVSCKIRNTEIEAWEMGHRLAKHDYDERKKLILEKIEEKSVTLMDKQYIKVSDMLEIITAEEL